MFRLANRSLQHQRKQLSLAQSRKTVSLTKRQVKLVDVLHDLLLNQGVDMGEHRRRGDPEYHLASERDFDCGVAFAVFDSRSEERRVGKECRL